MAISTASRRVIGGADSWAPLLHGAIKKHPKMKNIRSQRMPICRRIFLGVSMSSHGLVSSGLEIDRFEIS